MPSCSAQVATAVIFFFALGLACAVDTELTEEEQTRADLEAELLTCEDDQHCWDVCEERSRAVCIDGECAGCNIRQSLLGDDDDDDDDDDSAALGNDDDSATREPANGSVARECEEDADCGGTPCYHGYCRRGLSGGGDEFDCSSLTDGTKCAWGSGYCRDGRCMGEACWGGDLAWFDVRTVRGDCLTWGGDGPDTDTYRYAGVRSGGGVLDNADCIVGIANGLWWAGWAGWEGSLRIDGKAVPEEDTKLNDAVINGDHILEWGGEEYEMQTRTLADGDVTTLTICYPTPLRPDDVE